MNRGGSSKISEIELIESINEEAWNLLLLADETREAVSKYLGLRSETNVTKDTNTGEPVGVVVIHRDNEDNSIEIKNIAVKENLQSTGIGEKMIDQIKSVARTEGRSRVTVGTSITTETGQRRLKFYERNGFLQYAVLSNFFVDEYTEPVMEDDEQLTDMVMFEYIIK